MGIRSRILSATLLPSWEKETPKSKTTRRRIQVQYCTCRGLSSPYKARILSFTSAVALGLRSVAMSMGEPGARWMTAKEMMVIPINRGTMRSRRLRT